MLKPGQHIDRFLVEAEIGRGGMGVVFRVRHVELDSLFALKVVAVNQPGLHARLVQEGRAQARIRHPNVVNVADVLKETDLVGLVMEFVNGPTLDRWLGLRIPAVHEVEDLYLGIVGGVEHAHAAGVIHRDLKARNILLEINASTIVPKVSDFGIARFSNNDGGADMRLTLDNVPMGTPGYMAPEQVRNARDVDHRADVFALGVLLYRLLCGTTPFDAEDSFEVMDRTVRGDYVPPRRLRNDIPVRMERTILSCLQVDPARRPQSCAEIRDMLRSGAPRSLPPPPRTEGFPLGLESAGWGESGAEAAAVAELRAALAGEGSGSYRRPSQVDPRLVEARPPEPRPPEPRPLDPRLPEPVPPRAPDAWGAPLPPEAPRSRSDLRPVDPRSGESRLGDAPQPEARAAERPPEPRYSDGPESERPPLRLPPTEPFPLDLPPPVPATGGAEVLPADALPSRLEGAVRAGAPLLAIFALVAAVVAAFVAFQDDSPEPVVAASEPAHVEVAPAPVEPVVAPAEPVEAVTPAATPSKKTTPKSSKSSKSVAETPTTVAPVEPATAEAAPTGPGPTEVWMRFTSRVVPQRVSLACVDGKRQQAAVTGGGVRFSGLTAGVRCDAQPETTMRMYAVVGVRAGGSYNCSVMADVGTTTCR